MPPLQGVQQLGHKAEAGWMYPGSPTMAAKSQLSEPSGMDRGHGLGVGAEPSGGGMILTQHFQASKGFQLSIMSQEHTCSPLPMLQSC